MLRKNGLLGLLVLFALLPAVSSLGVAFAQQTQPTPQPTAQAAQSAASEYPYLGVRLADTSDGIVVRQVMDSSPASSAGIKTDDLIQKLNTTAVANVAAFADTLQAMKVGDKITLDIMRDSKAMTLNALLGSTTMQESIVTNTAFNAIAFDSADNSWQVFSLATPSDLATAGLQASDKITMFNGTAYSPADLQKFLDGLTDKDQVKLTVERAGKSMDITAPSTAFKSLDLFNYAKQGMLLDLVTPTQTSQPAVNLGDLNHTMTFDVFGYSSADKSWQIFGLADGSSLATAGLKPDDQITQFDGATYDPSSLQTYRDKLADDAKVKLTVMRAGKSMDVTVPAATLNSLHLFDYQTNGMLFGMPANLFGASVGATTLPLTADIAKQHNLKQTDGALVIEILPNTPAATAGLKPDDVITAVDKQKVDATHTLDSLLATHNPGDKVTFSIVRADKTMDVESTLAQPDISGEIPFLIRPF